MGQFTIFATSLLLFTCAIVQGGGEPMNPMTSGGGGVTGVVSPKNVRILSPAVTKLYRMIRRGQLDDDDLFAEDENNYKKRQYDDYGHMRFGKRNQPSKDFDDYGHLRFGK